MPRRQNLLSPETSPTTCAAVRNVYTFLFFPITTPVPEAAGPSMINAPIKGFSLVGSAFTP